MRANKIAYVELENHVEGIFPDGRAFCFDKQDFDFIKSTNWHINNSGYVQSNKYKMLHRYLMSDNLIEGLQVDHINNNRLDNRRSNLRVVTQLENLQKKIRYKSNKTGVPGVSWHKGRRKWQAQINIDGKRIYLGIFDELQDAIVARKKAEQGTALI